MGIFHKKKNKEESEQNNIATEPPKLIRRSINRRSTIKSGRTIAERREKLETASERSVARKKDKRKQAFRIIFTVIGFGSVAAITTFFIGSFLQQNQTETGNYSPTVIVPYSPTIEVIDEDSKATGEKSQITSRMKEYIGQAEFDFRELSYTPTKVVIPSGSIREVDFYLDGYSGFIKLIIDRETAVSVEDADRVIRYLSEQGITDFEYIDVRIEGKAYWK